VFTCLVAVVFNGVLPLESSSSNRLGESCGKEQSGTGSGTRKHRGSNGALDVVERDGRPIEAMGLCCPNYYPRTGTGAQACCGIGNHLGICILKFGFW